MHTLKTESALCKWNSRFWAVSQKNKISSFIILDEFQSRLLSEAATYDVLLTSCSVGSDMGVGRPPSCRCCWWTQQWLCPSRWEDEEAARLLQRSPCDRRVGSERTSRWVSSLQTERRDMRADHMTMKNSTPLSALVPNKDHFSTTVWLHTIETARCVCCHGNIHKMFKTNNIWAINGSVQATLHTLLHS